jgi:hypothetical protein
MIDYEFPKLAVLGAEVPGGLRDLVQQLIATLGATWLP